jgi:hypothetical protein
MKGIATRIRKLGTRSWPQVDKESHRIAMVLYERRLRRVEAEGRTDKPPVLSVGPTLSIAETLRRRRAERRAALDAETQR